MYANMLKYKFLISLPKVLFNPYLDIEVLFREFSIKCIQFNAEHLRLTAHSDMIFERNT